MSTKEDSQGGQSTLLRCSKKIADAADARHADMWMMHLSTILICLPKQYPRSCVTC